MKPVVALMYTEGLNREAENTNAFEQAGAKVEMVHLNELRENPDRLDSFQILLFPGGFSYGDHIASAQIWAQKTLAYAKDALQRFAEEDKLILGTCNGFQFLVRVGLLPNSNLGKIEATLTHNTHHFESRWVNVRVEKSDCIFTRGMEGTILRQPISHGEGRFLAPEATLEKLEENDQVVLRYVDAEGNPTQDYPANPNGSTHAIAGICSENGRIFGEMPHPECNVNPTQHPNWNGSEKPGGECLQMFKNAVEYFN